MSTLRLLLLCLLIHNCVGCGQKGDLARPNTQAFEEWQENAKKLNSPPKKENKGSEK